MLNTRQNGVALITAMIITTIAVTLATTVMYRQQIQIRLSSNISHLEQAYLYANGMEDWAGTILLKSSKDNLGYTSLADDWYSENALVLPIEGGIMQGKLTDLQSRINLNSLLRPLTEIKPIGITNNDVAGADENANTEKENQDDVDPNNNKLNQKKRFIDVSKITRQRLKSLMEYEIDPQQNMGTPDSVVDVIKDWIDPDQLNGNRDSNDESGGGAESPYYQTLEKAYFTADTEMVSTTELRLLKDMTPEIYTKLKKYISVLPIKDSANKYFDTPLNVNTASEAVLKAIGFDLGMIENILEIRKDEPFKKLEDFKNLEVVKQYASESSIEESLKDLDVDSNYFLLEGSVEINNARLFINSILERKNGKVSVIMRDFSNPESISIAEEE